jgi:hypothetical protein
VVPAQDRREAARVPVQERVRRESVETVREGVEQEAMREATGDPVRVRLFAVVRPTSCSKHTSWSSATTIAGARELKELCPPPGWRESKGGARSGAWSHQCCLRFSVPSKTELEPRPCEIRREQPTFDYGP